MAVEWPLLTLFLPATTNLNTFFPAARTYIAEVHSENMKLSL
jgi:hypothetical protein